MVDLGEGQEWWQTRMLLLTAGATRLGRPRVLVFTATVSGQSKQFVAWATPGELLRVHLRNASPQLQEAYRRAQARAGQWALGEPTGNNHLVTLPWVAPGSTIAATLGPLGAPPPQLIPEQFLLTELAACEPPSPEPMPDLVVTVGVLHSLFIAVLRKDSVGRSDPDARWRDAILEGTDEYLAVTERGAYVTLVSRQAAINAVLRSLVPAEPAPAPAAGTRPGR